MNSTKENMKILNAGDYMHFLKDVLQSKLNKFNQDDQQLLIIKFNELYNIYHDKIIKQPFANKIKELSEKIKVAEPNEIKRLLDEFILKNIKKDLYSGLKGESQNVKFNIRNLKNYEKSNQKGLQNFMDH